MSNTVDIKPDKECNKCHGKVWLVPLFAMLKGQDGKGHLLCSCVIKQLNIIIDD